MKMEDLIGAVGVSVQRAQNMLEQAAMDQYLNYFERPDAAIEEDSAMPRAMAARTLCLALPGEERLVEVPLLAFTSHNTLRLEQVNVKLNLVPAVAEENGGLDVAAGPAGEESHTVEMVFRCEGPNEAVARISDNANKLI